MVSIHGVNEYLLLWLLSLHSSMVFTESLECTCNDVLCLFYFRKQRPRTPPIITQHPSEDHSYSLLHIPDDDDFPDSPDSSIDEEYEFGADDDMDEDSDVSDTSRDSEFNDSGGEEEFRSPPRGVKRSRLSLGANMASPIKKRLLTAKDAEEEMKIVEGADALLNLAGINTSNMIPKRTESPTVHNNNNNNNNSNIKKEVLSQA